MFRGLEVLVNKRGSPFCPLPVPKQLRVQGTVVGHIRIQTLGTGYRPRELGQPWNQPVGRRPQADTGPFGLDS